MRKKIAITLIFIFMAVTVYLNCFYQEKSNNFYNLVKAGETEMAMSVVFSSDLQDKEEMYECIMEVLKDFDANLYCLQVEEIGGKEVYTKYIYASNLGKFNDLSLKKGRFFDASEMEGEKFLSSLKLDDPNCIGIIHTFDKNTNLQIKTLKTYICDYDIPFEKTFILELKTDMAFDLFKEELLKDGIFVMDNTAFSDKLNLAPFITAALFFAVFVLVLIIFYDLIKSYKQVGIEKMLGYNSIGIWSSRIPKLVAWEGIVFIITMLILSVFFLNAINVLVWRFIGKVMLFYVLIMLLTFGLCSLPFAYVEHIPVVSVIKNRKPLKSLMRFNLIIKCIITIGLLLILSAVYTQIMLVAARQSDRFRNWEKMKDFACVSELQPMEDEFCWDSSENLEKWRKVYLDFNKQGGIMADFKFYSPLYAEEFAKSEFPDYREVTVNPNYLKMFPIQDEDGKEIFISESEKDSVVLVPAMYKGREEELRSYCEWLLEAGANEKQNQKLKILWMKDNQKLFSCMLDVNPSDSNCVENPLVYVITAANATTFDTSNVVGTTGNPFKIKVKNGKDPKPAIDMVMYQYFDQDEVIFPAVSVYQGVEDQIKVAQDMLIIYAIIFIVLLIMSFATIMQNIITYIEQYKKILAVKKFFGYRMIDKYIGYFGRLATCYLVSGMIALLIKRDMKIVLLEMALLAVDFIFSLVYISIQDRKNIIQITKGDLG